ncbi:MAG: hypothetical protein Q9164_004665, partial [Protoblastenia rupestris]
MAKRGIGNIAALAQQCKEEMSKLRAEAADEDCIIKEFLSPRDVQHLKQSIIINLTDLCESIGAALDIALGKRQNRTLGASGALEGTDYSESNVSSSESDSSSNTSFIGQDALAPTTEIQELLAAMRIGIDNLFKTSIFIRQYSSRDKRRRAAETQPFDNRADIMHIKDRFPLLAEKNATLAERLGEANARRRQYFKYRRNHNERLSMGPAKANVSEEAAKPDAIGPKNEPTKTLTTSQVTPTILAETEATKLMAKEAEQARKLELPEVARPKSILSFATSIANAEDNDFQFPRMPAEAGSGLSFICPFCFEPQHFKRQGLENQWRKHVFQDLEPYICTFPSCGLETFKSQHAWFEHELMAHRNQWTCSGCSLCFDFSSDLMAHIKQKHQGLVAERQLPTYLDQMKRSVDALRPEDCPFCDGSWAHNGPNPMLSNAGLGVTIDDFRGHLGQHLQQISLFSLPRLINENDQSLGSLAVGGTRNQGSNSNPLEKNTAGMESQLREHPILANGITELCQPEDQGEIAADIVFVHGLGGHPRRTWECRGDVQEVTFQTNPALRGLDHARSSRPGAENSKLSINPRISDVDEERTSVFWPLDLLPHDIPNVRILTYGYVSDARRWVNDLATLGKFLLRDLSRSKLGCPHRPVIVVAHSTGGLVVKEALVQSNKNANTIAVVPDENTPITIPIEHDIQKINQDHVNICRFNDRDDEGYEKFKITIQGMLDAVNKEQKQVRKRILQALDSPGRLTWKEQIEELDDNTVDWIWQIHASKQSFSDWLQNDDSIFWINGGPGTGKSTHIRHLVRSQEMRNRLAANPGSKGRKWQIAQCFLHGRIEGFENLIRSLCVQIIAISRESRRGIESQFHQASNMDNPDGLRLLQQALTHLLEDSPHDWCFFIDGIDEYLDGVEELLTFLQHLPASRKS